MNFEPLRSAVLLTGVLLLASSCKTRNPQPPAQPPAEIPPAEYGQPGDIPMPPGQEGGRFGYRGGDAGEAPPAPPRPGTRDVREMDNGGVAEKPKKEEPKPPKPSGPPAQMQYANSVPGNPLVVTLPGANSSLGKISIEKYDSAGNPTGEPLKRGTQVQIPDPNNPGKKIYFKVP